MSATNTPPDSDNLVRPEDACPNCGERDADELVWLDPPNDDRVRCANCGTEYKPGEAGAGGGSHATPG